MKDVDKLRMILHDTHERATRHHRATDAHETLLWDLEYVEKQVAEAREVLDRLHPRQEDSHSTDDGAS